MSILIQIVVGELQLVECDRLLQPVGPRGRAVRVDVESPGHVGLGFPRHHPLGVVVLVAAVVQGYDVDQEDVLGVGVQALESDLQGGEHTSENSKNNL